MHSRHYWVMVCLLAAIIGVLPARAGQVYTVGGDSGKTIASGLAQLQPGDTLSILPGTYHETINIPCDKVTIEGAGPGVVLEGSVALTAKDFAPTDRAGVYSWQLPADTDLSHYYWVFYNGQPMVYSQKPLDPAKQAWCCYADKQTHRLEVIFNGKSFPEGATILVPTLNSLVRGWGHKQVTIRGLEAYRSVDDAINCEQGLIEDNLVMWAGIWGITPGENTTVTRNTVKFCDCSGILLGGNRVNIENNLLVANGLSFPFATSGETVWLTSNTKMNANFGSTFQQNWILDSPRGGLIKYDGSPAMNDGKPVIHANPYMATCGLWPDCDCFNDTFIDNAVARQSGQGIYIEAGCDRCVVTANDVQDCGGGITLRTSSNGVVTRNWVWDRECLGWGTVDKEAFGGYANWGYDDKGVPTTKLSFDPAKEGTTTYGRGVLDGISLWQTHIAPENDWCEESTRDNVIARNLVQVSGDTVGVPLYRQRDWPDAQATAQSPSSTIFSNQFSGNFYTLPRNKTTFALLGTRTVSFADYRKLTGWDGNAQLGNFTPSAVLGLEPIWTIPGLSTDTQTPVSILYDPTLELHGVLATNEPLFWHGSNVHDWAGNPVTRYEEDQKLARSGRCCISVTNVRTPSPDDRPLGWYSSAIPVKAGITMAVNLWIDAEALTAAKDGSGARVSMRFTDATGHLVSEAVIVGDGHHPELLVGTYAWTNVDGQAVVPANAYWLTVYLGDDPSDGTVRFDDIHINMRNPIPPQFPRN